MSTIYELELSSLYLCIYVHIYEYITITKIHDLYYTIIDKQEMHDVEIFSH